MNLHGWMQPGAGWFNGENGCFQSPSDYTDPRKVAPALSYYNAVSDIMTNRGPIYGKDHGWNCRFVRFIGDGSAPVNFAPGWDAAGNLSKPGQFIGWLNNVVVPYVEHCRANGLYVVLVGNPSEIFPDGKDGKPDPGRNMTKQYQDNLIEFWKAVASYPAIKNADNVMFEICNEPIAIETKFGAGDWGFGNDDRWQAITSFMQPVADAIRNEGANNVVWVPGLGWQGEYQGYAKYPVQGSNIGYAAHIYPAYGGAHDDPAKITRLWNNNYKACADMAPMIVTEMMWEPNDGVGYKGLWNAHTSGFGNGIKAEIDKQGNVSYLIGMTADHFDTLKNGLANARPSTREGSVAAFEWFKDYETKR